MSDSETDRPYTLSDFELALMLEGDPPTGGGTSHPRFGTLFVELYGAALARFADGLERVRRRRDLPKHSNEAFFEQLFVDRIVEYIKPRVNREWRGRERYMPVHEVLRMLKDGDGESDNSVRGLVPYASLWRRDFPTYKKARRFFGENCDRIKWARTANNKLQVDASDYILLIAARDKKRFEETSPSDDEVELVLEVEAKKTEMREQKKVKGELPVAPDLANLFEKK